MKWSFKFFYAVCFVIFSGFSFEALGQTFVTCNSTFQDLGGNSDYDVIGPGSGNGDLQYTYCSSSPNQGIRVIFSQFTIKTVDSMYVYDGPNSSSPLIGVFTGNTNIRSSFYSTETCLTFKFVSNPATIFDVAYNSDYVASNPEGWNAQVTCYNLPTSTGFEICGNGMDDDGDGLIDEMDVDCIGQGENVLDLNCEEALSYYFPPVWRMIPTADDPTTPNNELTTGPTLFNSAVSFNISTLFPTANITITNLDGFSQNYSVNAGTVLNIPITYASGFTQTANSNVIENGKGILITSSVPIFVTYSNESAFNKLIVTGKNSEGLGKSFFVASQTNARVAASSTVTNTEAHFISVMASEDNTTINFNFANPLSNGGAGTLTSPFSIMLDRGQTYLLRDPLINATVSGVMVTADKDIAVTSGSMHTAQVGTDGSNPPKRDGGVDVLIPVKNLGTDHVVVSSLAISKQEYAIIVAVEDTTEVFINGSLTPIVTLDRGQFYQYNPNQPAGTPTYIRTSIPSYVYYISGISTDEVDMGLVGSISECRGSRKISFNKFNGATNAVQVVIPLAGLASLELNGVAYGGSPIAVPGLAGYFSITIPNADLAAGTNTIESDVNFTASQVVGTNDGGAFGYLTSFTSKLFAKDPSTNLATNLIVIPAICNLDSFTQALTFEGCSEETIRLKASKLGPQTQNIRINPDSLSFTYFPVPGSVGFDTITLAFENDLGVQGAVCLVFNLSNPLVSLTINGEDT
ncbi:MAG: hypothetical protein KDC49_11070 [Saprospiraceae bacterium]|nr:hypothetical protein [Saprospiraceae bacterium]